MGGVKGFNCTFMELKSPQNVCKGAENNVLIVPLWNWNDELDNSTAEAISFNCTFMELK